MNFLFSLAWPVFFPLGVCIKRFFTTKVVKDLLAR